MTLVSLLVLSCVLAAGLPDGQGNPSLVCETAGELPAAVLWARVDIGRSTFTAYRSCLPSQALPGLMDPALMATGTAVSCSDVTRDLVAGPPELVGLVSRCTFSEPVPGAAIWVNGNRYGALGVGTLSMGTVGGVPLLVLAGGHLPLVVVRGTDPEDMVRLAVVEECMYLDTAAPAGIVFYRVE